MPFTSHPSAQYKEDNDNSLRSLWCATLEIFFHSILFTRHLYPKETFAPTKFLGVQCRVSRHQDVVAYISEAVKVIVPAIIQGISNRATLELFEHGKSTKREVYCLDFNQQPWLQGANVKLWERDFQNLVLSAYSLDRESPGWKSSATFKIRLLIDDETKSCNELDSALQNGKWFCPRTNNEAIRLNETGKIAYEMAQCHASFSFFKE